MSNANEYVSESLIWLIFFLPLASFVLSLIIPERYSWLVSLLSSLIFLGNTICSTIVLTSFWNSGTVIIPVEWFTIGDLPISANLSIANHSVLMLFVVNVISFLVHLYSVGYMAGDSDVRRYFAMLGFFTFSMIGIVLADSLLLVFFFWELVGFSSYLLIGHYTSDFQSGIAAKKAFIMNRIGDVGFIIGLMIIWTNTGTFNISELPQHGATYAWQTFASLMIFAGVIGKSAQFPLLTWLPDAMKGPTPVSALIHAATMVAAGVYLTTRVFGLFTEVSLQVVAITGAITAILGALGALTHYDIKKILAFSTVSQLGLMITAVGMGFVDGALLHLFTHAFFKACLFLCAGSVIHSLALAFKQSSSASDTQDIRNMGGLIKKLPVTSFAFLISSASLAGVPFFSGFLSKEAILTAIWTHTNVFSWIILSVIIGVSILTVIYTFRLVWYVFFATPSSSINNATEVSLIMRGPVILLAACSFWFIVSWHPLNFTGWMLPVNGTYHASGVVTLLSIAYVIITLLCSWLFFRSRTPKTNGLLRNVFYLDHGYRMIYRSSISPASQAVQFTDRRVIDRMIHGVIYAHVTLGHIVAWADRHIIDGTVHLFVFLSRTVGKTARSFQGGKVQQYIFWAAFAVIIFLICALN